MAIGAPGEKPTPAPAPVPAAPPAAPAPAPVAPTTDVDRVVSAALRNENVELKDVKDVLVKQKAEVIKKTKDMTSSQLDQLSATFEREEREHDAELTVDGSKAELAKLRSEIQIAAVAKAPSVKDAEVVADPNKPQTMVDRLKSFANAIGLAGIGGTLLSWLRSAQGMLAGIGLPVGDGKTLEKTEEKFKAFFGAAEVRDIANGALQGTDIEVRKGSKDMAGYLKIQSRYNAALAAKLLEVGGKDPAGKPIEIPTAMQEQIKSQFPFRAFLEQEVKAYAAKFPEPGKKRITTLSGIANSEKPTIVDA